MSKARQKTDKILAEMEKHIDKLYSTRRKDIEREWNKYMAKQEKRLHGLYKDVQKAKKTGVGYNEALSKYQAELKKVTLQSGEYRKVVDATVNQISDTNQEAVDYINKKLAEIYFINYSELIIDGMSKMFVNKQAVEALAKSDRAFLPYKQLDKYKDKIWNEKFLNAQVLQGIQNGESVEEIRRRIAPEISKAFDFTGKTGKELKSLVKKNRDSAIRNARTMVTSAENKGKYDSMKEAQEQGFIVKKRWISAHDGHTRDAHVVLDGVEIDLDEEFENQYGVLMYPADPDGEPANVYNCRCTMEEIIIGHEKIKGRWF